MSKSNLFLCVHTLVHSHFDFQNLCKSAEAVSSLVNHSDLFKTYANQLKLYPHWSIILIIQYKFGHDNRACKFNFMYSKTY